MALNNMSDGVGKKIVEALKMQDDVSNDEMSLEENTVSTSASDDWDNFNSNPAEEFQTIQDINTTISQPSVDEAFKRSIANNIGASPIAFSDDFDYPANVAVLKQLITKLPTGVSKQTGALIIKQTMEALGISMSNVLQEARQVQETFANNSKECQNNIVEYKKQITILEAKAQQYQRQYNVMNDIISLFLHSGR